MRNLSTVAAVVLVVALVAGCGGSSGDGPSAQQSVPTAADPTPTVAQAKERGGRLLDTWSDKLLTTMLAAQTRGKAAASGNVAAYKTADAKLRPLLRDVSHLAAQGRAVMSRFPASDVRRLVVADGDAWQVWALPLLADRDPSMQKARRIADLGAEAFVAHEAAYRASGKAPPLAFQRRADQK